MGLCLAGLGQLERNCHLKWHLSSRRKMDINHPETTYHFCLHIFFLPFAPLLFASQSFQQQLPNLYSSCSTIRKQDLHVTRNIFEMRSRVASVTSRAIIKQPSKCWKKVSENIKSSLNSLPDELSEFLRAIQCSSRSVCCQVGRETGHRCRTIFSWRFDLQTPFTDWNSTWGRYDMAERFHSFVCKKLAAYPMLFFLCVAGEHCERQDHCASSPCRNGAECRSLEDSYKCTCAPGFTGPNCADDIDECDRNPCRHGSCKNIHGSYK